MNDFRIANNVGCHVVNGLKVGTMLQADLEYFKSDNKWVIHLRLYSGPSGCRVPS